MLKLLIKQFEGKLNKDDEANYCLQDIFCFKWPTEYVSEVWPLCLWSQTTTHIKNNCMWGELKVKLTHTFYST